MRQKRIKFGELKVGDWFYFQNRKFRKTLEVKNPNPYYTYNAITEEVNRNAYISLILDDKYVYIEVING
jgi:hypothetical protein